MGMYNDKPLTEFGLECEPGSSMTKQQFANECDINQILKRVQKTEMLDHLAMGEPFYADVSEFQMDYKSALDFVNRANDEFYKLSPEIRGRFENDPGKLIEFLGVPENAKEAMELGLVNKKAVDEPKMSVDTGQAQNESVAKG